MRAHSIAGEYSHLCEEKLKTVANDVKHETMSKKMWKDEKNVKKQMTKRHFIHEKKRGLVVVIHFDPWL